MLPSAKCEALIKGSEGCELTAYPDPGSALGRECAKIHLPMRRYEEIGGWQKYSGHPWTVGFGSTAGVYPGLTITAAAAEARFRTAMDSAAEYVLHALGETLVTQNQLDALTALAYNVGIGHLVTSGLISFIQSGNRTMTERLWLSLNHSSGVVLPGLTTRRAAEVALFVA